MTKKAQFKIDGLLKLEKVGDYLNLVGKKVKLVFKEKDAALNTKSFLKADVDTRLSSFFLAPVNTGFRNGLFRRPPIF